LSMQEAKHSHAQQAYNVAANSDDPATRLRATELGDAIMDETRGQSAGIRHETNESARDAEKGLLSLAEKTIRKPSGGGGGDALDAVIKASKASSDATEAWAKAHPEAKKELLVPDGRGGFAQAISPTDAADKRDLYGIVREYQRMADWNEQLVSGGLRWDQIDPSKRGIFTSNVQSMARLTSKIQDKTGAREGEMAAFASNAGDPLSLFRHGVYTNLRNSVGRLYTETVGAGTRSEPLFTGDEAPPAAPPRR